MSAQNMSATTRRRFIQAAAAAGMGAATVSGLAPTAAGGSEAPAVASGLADAILQAFNTHRLVGVGEIHGLQTHGDALTLLLADPRLADVVDDIVVEFGNALYQNTIDRFIAGQPVADADLRHVWRNTVVSPLDTYDEPMYEQAYRTIRAANWGLPAHKRIRVLLGDVPIDWSKTTTTCEWMAPFQTRDHYFASVVKEHVLAKGRRALLLKGLDGFVRPNAIEQVTGERVYALVDLAFAASDPGGVGKQLAQYPRFTVIPAAGTWLGSADAGLLFGDVGPPGPGPGQEAVARRRCRNGKPFGKPIKPRGGNSNAGSSPYCGKTVKTLVDAGLYLGQPGELTASLPNPAIYLDPTYWKELQRRNTIGASVDLEWWRQKHPQANVDWWRPLQCARPARAGR